jgi:addiction module HigA family antidote
MTRNTPRVAGHPGFVVLKYFMWPVGCGIDKAARLLDISPVHMQGFLEGHIDLDDDLAARLTSVFGRSAAFWRELQSKHDAWKAYCAVKDSPVLQTVTAPVAEASPVGAVLQEQFLAPSGMSVDDLAKRLCVPARYLRKLVAGSGQLYTALAEKLAEVFGTTRDYWLNMLPQKAATA